MRKLKRKNPGGVINGIRYNIDFKASPELVGGISKKTAEDWEYVQFRDFEYKFIRIIEDLSKIINAKFKLIVSKLPTIVLTFQDADLLKHLKYAKEDFNQFDNSIAVYDKLEKIILLNSKFLYDDYEKDWDSNKYKIVYDHNKILRILFHEIGHFVYYNYISNESLKFFDSYIFDNIKKLNINKLMIIVQKYPYSLQQKFPIIYVIIKSLSYSLGYDKDSLMTLLQRHKQEIGTRFYSFTKPVSDMMPYIIKTKKDAKNMAEEIFAEMFANYMMYDKHMLSNDNYKILKIIIPELR